MFRFDGEKWVPFAKKVTYTQTHEYYMDGTDIPDLPNINVVAIMLTNEQLKRLEMVKTIEDMGIDALTKYVMTDELPQEYPQMEIKVEEEKTKETLLSMVDFTKATSEQVMSLKPLFREWKDDGTYYSKGQLVTDEGIIYKVIIGSPSQPSWKPKLAVSLFAKVLTDPTGISILTWVQPLSTNPYKLGDKVTHKGKTWESMNNNNTWEPGAIGVDDRIWKEVKS